MGTVWEGKVCSITRSNAVNLIVDTPAQVICQLLDIVNHKASCDLFFDIGLAIAMKQGANLLQFGDALKAQMQKVESELPIGVGVHLVSDQPRMVEEAVGHFTQSLFEAIVIVLVVSFVSLGLRAGLVVALNARKPSR